MGVAAGVGVSVGALVELVLVVPGVAVSGARLNMLPIAPSTKIAMIIQAQIGNLNFFFGGGPGGIIPGGGGGGAPYCV